jgi:heme/copper-type cytochrome/quinol oxidase subunit 1
MIVSLLAPGLGLLLLEKRDRVKDALAIFGAWFAYFVISFLLTFVVVGVCCWLPLPLLHVAAGIHSFDEATLEQGGKPLLFRTGFRIFKD